METEGKQHSLSSLRNPDFARCDPATVMASIFRPVCRGRRPRGLDVTYRFAGLSLRFICYEWLDVRDQSVLLACCALAGLSNKGLGQNAGGKIGQQLWLALEPSQHAAVDKAIVITTTYYQLRMTSGFADNSRVGYARLKEILFRLANVSCRAQKDGYDWSMRLLAYAAAPDGKIAIALNGRLASAIADQHIRISLSQRRELPSEIAELAHCWLTAWIRVGHQQRIGIDKLATRIWGGDGAIFESARRKRRERLKDALMHIDQLDGWSVQLEGRGGNLMAWIERKK